MDGAENVVLDKETGSLVYLADSRQQPDARRALRMSSPKRPSCNLRRSHIPAMVPTAYSSRTSGLLTSQSTHIEHSVYFVDRIRGSRKVFVPRSTRIGGGCLFRRQNSGFLSGSGTTKYIN